MYLPPISSIVNIYPMSMIYASDPPSHLLDNNAVKRIVRDALYISGLTVQRLDYLPRHLHRILKLQLSNDSKLVLKLSPLTTTPRLQHERYSLQSEAATLNVLSETNLPIPHLLKYDNGSNILGSPFLLTSDLPGTRYSDAITHLSPSERLDIDAQVQTLNSYINSYTATRFGPAGILAGGTGSSTWREAFHLMMRSILMDGEDMGVNLPYIEIRAAITYHAKCLNAIREARLVILNIGRPENVLIEKGTNNVTGLLDFGQAIWGDINFAEPEILPHADVRRSLYLCYHSLLTIVSNHYRPQEDYEKELGARKILTTALARLAVGREGA